MKDLWQYWTGIVDTNTNKSIFDQTANIPWQSTGLGFDGSTANNDYRRSEIKWINPSTHPQIRDLIWYYATVANKNAFGFDISMLSDIQLTKYDAVDEGKYDWHIDTFWGNPTTFDRKISVVIQLSDPEEYDGGQFLLSHEYPQPDPDAIKQKGSVIVFPSFLPHCVTPVTRGTRYSLVSWIEGPKFR